LPRQSARGVGRVGFDDELIRGLGVRKNRCEQAQYDASKPLHGDSIKALNITSFVIIYCIQSIVLIEC
jgi:hypothetical protein